MIRHIVALDSKRGIAKDGAMPSWHLKQDERYFMQQTKLYGGYLLMGKATFQEALHEKPLPDRTNFVLTYARDHIDGVELVNDLEKFIQDWPIDKDLWIIGGAALFEQTLAHADELLITEIKVDYDCDRFYPAYEDDFEIVSRSEPITEHGISYTFCIYKR